MLKKIIFAAAFLFLVMTCFQSCTTPPIDKISVTPLELREVPFGSELFNIHRNSRPTRNFSNQLQFSDQVRQQLVYTGTNGTIIKLTYNEYTTIGSTWVIKPAFTQILEYDLNISKNITFRGIKMEIIEADNNHILYRILDWK